MLIARHFKAIREIKTMGAEKDIEIFVESLKTELFRRKSNLSEGHKRILADSEGDGHPTPLSLSPFKI